MVSPETIVGTPEQHGWLVLMDPLEKMPTADLYIHRGGMGCWCHPVLDDEDSIIHVSADGREAFETGRRQLS